MPHFCKRPNKFTLSSGAIILYGAVIGAVLLVFAQNYLQDLLAVAHKALAGVPLLANFFHPDRWLLWLGVAFILCVYFFPTGIVGRLRNRR